MTLRMQKFWSETLQPIVLDARMIKRPSPTQDRRASAQVCTAVASILLSYGSTKVFCIVEIKSGVVLLFSILLLLLS
jgi:hypothetical protein